MTQPRASLRVAASQMTVSAEVAENVRAIRRTLDQCTKRGVEIALFPETAISDYAPALGRHRRAETWPDLQAALAEVAMAARETGVWTVVGCDAWRDEGWVNRLYVFDAQGETMATYDKVHLTPDDWTYYQPGDESVLFHHDGVAIGLQICYDVRFPEGYRDLLHQGAQVILQGFYGAGGDTWKVPVMNAHIRARAAESGCFVVAANVAGPLQIVHSMVVDPLGLILAQANQDCPELLVADLDLGRVADSSIRRDYLGKYRP